MTALAVSYSGVLGGGERILLDAARGLDAPPLIACPEGPLAHAARDAGLGVFELVEHSLELRRGARDRVGAPARLLAHRAEVSRLLHRLEPELVIAWGMRTALALTALRRPGGPALVFQHNDLLPSPLVGRAVRRAAALADRVTTCSHAIARDLDPDGTLGTPVEAIPPGVDLDRFRPPSPSERDPDRVLVLGAIERWKRPDLALEAVARAASQRPGIHVRVVGEPIGADGHALLDQLRDRAEAPDLHGRVDFVGGVQDAAPELRSAGCLLHCSDREPYGMVVVEALASGTPAVVPDSFGPAEIVGDERCGGRYRPGDAEAAARCLLEVLGADAPTIAATARARAERRLDVRETRHRYATLLGELVGDRPPRVRDRPDRGAELAIVTVTHDSEPELARLLASLQRHLPEAQVIVVDSASSDGSVTAARAWRDGAAEVLALHENVGFGRAMNAGLELAQRPVAALMNPDTEVLDGSLVAAARAAAQHPDRLLAPLVLLDDGRRQDSVQHEPATAWLGMHALAPAGVLPRPLATAVEPWRGRLPGPVGWAVGAALVATRATLTELGPFDERTFMYAEDLDLGLRASDADVQTWFWPAARVRHSRAHSTERAFGGEPFDLLARRRRAVVGERRGTRRLAFDDALQAVTFAERAALKRLLGRDARRERRQLSALRNARRDQP